MKVVAPLVVAGAFLCSSMIVNAETNATTGRLGYPIGTPLKIEGLMKRPMKEYSLIVEKVNDKELRKPVIVSLGITCGPFIEFSNAVICLKGVEWIETVPQEVDPKTGIPILQQHEAGTFFRFAVQEVIEPEGLAVEGGYWKRKSEQTNAPYSSPAPQVQKR